MDELLKLSERIADLETWANEFSCRAEHADCPIFQTRADREEIENRLAALRARTSGDSHDLPNQSD